MPLSHIDHRNDAGLDCDSNKAMYPTHTATLKLKPSCIRAAGHLGRKDPIALESGHETQNSEAQDEKQHPGGDHAWPIRDW